MMRALGPEEKTVPFKGRVEKDVEIRIDQSLANNKFSKYHTPTVWKKDISSYTKGYASYMMLQEKFSV